MYLKMLIAGNLAYQHYGNKFKSEKSSAIFFIGLTFSYQGEINGETYE